MASQMEVDSVFVPCVSDTLGWVVPKRTVIFLALWLLQGDVKASRRAAAFIQAVGLPSWKPVPLQLLQHCKACTTTKLELTIGVEGNSQKLLSEMSLNGNQSLVIQS